MTFNTEYYEEWAKDNLYVVAFLNRSGENHQLSMQVVNSAEKDLTNTSINRVECLKNVTIENVNGSILVNGDAAVTVYDLSGSQVDNNNLSAGVYIVKAVVNGQAVAQKILVK
jgi:formylmethanofuran dehydrogenase subunit A